jgi:hypothetical protein
LQSLQDYFDRENVTFQNLEQVMMYLILAYEEMQKYLLDQKKLYLDVKSIYLQRQEPFRLFLCYCPFVPEEETGISRVMEYLLTIVDHQQETLAKLCYELYEKSLSGVTLYEMQQMIQDAREAEEHTGDIPYFAESVSPEQPIEEAPILPVPEEELYYESKGELLKERIRDKGQQLLEMILQWFRRDKTEGFREKDFEIEPEPVVCEPTVLLHAGEQKCEGRLLYQGNQKEEDFLIQNNIFRIGSAQKENDGWLHSQAVSRRHAKITRSQQQFYLEDLNSTNGTKINGQELNYQEKYLLANGDRIQFADVVYLFV